MLCERARHVTSQSGDASMCVADVDARQRVDLIIRVRSPVTRVPVCSGGILTRVPIIPT